MVSIKPHCCVEMAMRWVIQTRLLPSPTQSSAGMHMIHARVQYSPSTLQHVSYIHIIFYRIRIDEEDDLCMHLSLRDNEFWFHLCLGKLSDNSGLRLDHRQPRMSLATSLAATATSHPPRFSSLRPLPSMVGMGKKKKNSTVAAQSQTPPPSRAQHVVAGFGLQLVDTICKFEKKESKNIAENSLQYHHHPQLDPNSH